MATYQTNFRGYNIGELPSNYTGEWYAPTENKLKVISDTTLNPDSTKVLEWTGRNQIQESFFSFDEVGDPGTGRVQQYTVFEYNSINDDDLGLRHIYRGSGTVSTKNAAMIFFDLFGDARILGARFVSNVITFIGSSDSTPEQEADTEWHMLTEIDGSGATATLKGKLWKGTAGDEPGSWMYDEELGATIDTGKVGLGMYQGHANTVTIKYHSVGVGEDAPRQTDITDTKPDVGLGAGNFEKGCEITVNKDKVGGTSGTFEEYRHVLTRTAFPDDAITSGHADAITSSELRFIDTDGYYLPSEVIRWDLNADPSLSKVRVHVKVNDMDKNVDSTILAIWDYNGTVPTIDDDAEYGAFNSTTRMKASLPMNEDPDSDATDAILDVTRYAHHGTTIGTMVTADLVDVGDGGLSGLDFNGTDQGLELQDFLAGVDETNTNQVTHYARSCIVKMRGTATNRALISKNDSSGGNYDIWLQLTDLQTVTFDGTFDNHPTLGFLTDDDEFHHYMLVAEDIGANVQWKVWEDGVKIIDRSFATNFGSDNASTNGWSLMFEWDGGTEGDWNDGILSSVDFFDVQPDTIDEDLPPTLYEMFLNPATFYSSSGVTVAGAVETTVTTAVEFNTAVTAGREVYHTINVTGDSTYDMSAYTNIVIEEDVIVRALAGYTNKPLVTYDTTFVDGTFNGLFQMDTGSSFLNIDGRGKHANDVAVKVVQNFLRTIGANCTISGCHIYQWCKWAIRCDINQGHIIENNFIEEVWWDADDGLGFEFGGYGYAIWLEDPLTTTPADADVTIIRNNRFNNCRNFIDGGSQSGNSVFVRNNVFGYASQSAMDSHSGGYYKCEVSGNWFCNRRSGQSSLRIQDIQQNDANAFLLIENNVDADGTNVWYFGPTGTGDLNESNQLWPPSGDIFEPDAVNWDGVSPGEDYAIVDIQDNLFRQDAHTFPYDENGATKDFGMRPLTAGGLWDWESDSGDTRIMVLPNSRATQPNWVNAGTAGFTAGWTTGRALDIPAGAANHSRITNANCVDLQAGTSSISITFKAKQRSNTVAFASLFHFGASSASDPGYSVFWKNNGELLARMSDGTEQEQDTFNSFTLVNGTWYTFTIIFDRTLGQIRWYRDGALVSGNTHTFTTNIDTTQDIQSIKDAVIGDDFQNDGDFEIDFLHVDKRVIADWEVAAYHNGGNSIKSKSEIFLGNWDVNNTDVIKQRISTTRDQVGGLNNHRAISLKVTEDQLHDVFLDSDGALSLPSGGAELRASVERHDAPTATHTGIHQIPIKITAVTPNSNPALANFDIDIKLLDFHNSTSFMNGKDGHNVYIWKAPDSTAAAAVDGPYGGDIVDLAVSGLTTDETTTDTNEDTPNTFWGGVTLPVYGNGDTIPGVSLGGDNKDVNLILSMGLHL